MIMLIPWILTKANPSEKMLFLWMEDDGELEKTISSSCICMANAKPWSKFTVARRYKLCSTLIQSKVRHSYRIKGN